MISKQLSHKLTWLQLICAVMAITMHTAFATYFPQAAPWARALNTVVRRIDYYCICVFIFLSALLQFRKKERAPYLPLLRKRALTLLVPCLIWNVVFLVHRYVRQCLTLGRFADLPPIVELLCQLTVRPANYPLWTLLVFFMLAVLYPVLYWAVEKKWPAVLLFIMSVTLYMIPAVGLLHESTTNWLSVYLFGAMVGRYGWDRFTRIPFGGKRWASPAALVLLIVMAAFLPLPPPFDYLERFLYLLLMWIAADLFCYIPIQPWWAHTSFWLYCTHMIMEHYAVKLYGMLFGQGTLAFALGNWLLPLLCAVLCLIPAALLRKTRLYALLTGGRVTRR